MTESEKTAYQIYLSKIWKFIEHNRWTWIGPIVGLLLWVYALGCKPLTESPLVPGRMVNELQLSTDLKTWQAGQEIMIIKFEAAGQDIAQQKENNKKIEAMVLDLASGGIPDMAGLAKLIIGGLALGAGGDNIRKRGLIAGLKRNKTPNETQSKQT